MRLSRFSLIIVGAACAPAWAAAAPINQVNPSNLTGTALVTFEDVAGGAPPGTSYDGILESGTVAFAERFVGQTRTTSGVFDVLSGLPGGSLTLQVGAPNQNVGVALFGTSQVLFGIGPQGFPALSSTGEGSVAALFDFDQSELVFDVVGGEGGSATVQFFRRDGTLIDTVILGGLGDSSYGFQREGALRDIAGVSIFNDDGGGIGLDNLRSDVRGRQGPPGTIPWPAAGVLVVAGLGLARMLTERGRGRLTPAPRCARAGTSRREDPRPSR